VKPFSFDHRLSHYSNTRFLSRRFNDQCKALLRAIENPSIWGIFALPQIEFAVDERTVLIGDAVRSLPPISYAYLADRLFVLQAHATTPHQGAGAGQAVEDALFLSALLASPSTSSTPLSSRPSAITKALKVYQQERHSRAQKVQETSFEAGLLYEFLDPDAGSDLGRIKEDLEGRMKWIWEFDTEREVERVVGLLDKK